ncbi:MAG: dockerin type I repeat-containing protein [Ruminococcus sp.]|nr:dockerin type I repeat-containing protein [Ruminococcus sp.]
MEELKSKFEKYLNSNGIYNTLEGTEFEGEPWYTFKEHYYNTSENEYILVSGGDIGVGPMPIYGVYGDYCVVLTNHSFPYGIGYYVYSAEDDEFYTLRQAWTEIDGIENVFKDYALGVLIGDMNGDRSLNIKDATEIQKCVSGISAFPADDEIEGIAESRSVELKYLSDFNRDGERNVKDATAIQKKIAGLEY